MSMEERFGFRDAAYSAWHRHRSLSRYMPQGADKIGMIDTDGIFVEYRNYSGKHYDPIAMVEVAQDIGQQYKHADVIAAICKMASGNGHVLQGYTVLYRLSEQDNPIDPRCKDIDQFRVQRVWPDPETTWQVMTPQDYASFLETLPARRVQWL